ncbi:MAG: hypothetical protein E7I68_02220 [Neisseria sp.]|nr:hypothetical protein [Neisseria sp.]
MKEVILIWYIFICFYYSFCFARVSFLIGKQESLEELEFVDKGKVIFRITHWDLFAFSIFFLLVGLGEIVKVVGSFR